MGVKRLNYAALAKRLLKISSEIARRPMPKLPRTALVSLDTVQIQHTPLPARSPFGRWPDTFALKACIIDSLQKELAKVEEMAAAYRADFERGM